MIKPLYTGIRLRDSEIATMRLVSSPKCPRDLRDHFLQNMCYKYHLTNRHGIDDNGDIVFFNSNDDIHQYCQENNEELYQHSLAEI